MSCEISIEVVPPPEIVLEVQPPPEIVLAMEWQRGEKGDPGPGGPPGSGDAPIIEAENLDSVTIHAGMAVARYGSGFRLASIASVSRRAFGVAANTAAPGHSVSVQPNGLVELADWAEPTGQVSLPLGETLFLSGDGTLSPNPSIGSGQIVQIVGEVNTASSLILRIGEPTQRS